jgi:predicted type IV restriction endonuclease
MNGAEQTDAPGAVVVDEKSIEDDVVDSLPAISVAAPKAAATSRGGRKWEQAAKDRIRAALRRYAKPLNDLVARDANEGDTRLFVTDLLCDVFGYDKYENLTTEFQVRGEFADFGIRLEKQLVAFIEVKRATTKLGAKHLRQVEMYAVNEGVPWLLLTNGGEWRVYHLAPGMPVTIDLAFVVSLTDSQVPLATKIDQLFYLTKEAMKRDLIESLWKQQAATAPAQLLKALNAPAVVAEIRREIRKRSGQNVKEFDISRLIRETLVRQELLK